ncbi:hypothetical protein [Grimontia celer]|uniref:hypothetical protein n=1 Tax=Grimontia celer TaxID=1796497 RepID=UPI000AA2C6AA|nr:hypothetical protein [Grimontia celer]
MTEMLFGGFVIDDEVAVDFGRERPSNLRIERENNKGVVQQRGDKANLGKTKHVV